MLVKLTVPLSVRVTCCKVPLLPLNAKLLVYGIVYNDAGIDCIIPLELLITNCLNVDVI